MARKSGVVAAPIRHFPMIAWHNGFLRLLPAISRLVWKLLRGWRPSI